MEAVKSKIRKETSGRTSQQTIAEKFLEPIAVIPDVVPQLVEFVKPGVIPAQPEFPQQGPVQKSLDHIFHDFSKGHISFFGAAGSGKTTLLKIIARNTMSRKYEGLNAVEVVVFLQCCDLDPSSKKLPMGHLLINVPGITPEDTKVFSKFLEKSPEKVLFVLDGLDTFASDDRSAKKIVTKLNKEVTAPQTIFSLLRGQLYSGCRVITSTRDYTSENYKHIDPGRIVGLAGLNENDIFALVRCYFSENEAKDVIAELQKTPVLLALCQTPVFLVFSLIGRKRDPNFSPTTISQVIVFLLESFVRSKHVKQEGIQGVLKKLQLLSFQLACNGRVNFSGGDLERIGLNPQMVKDVSIMIPGGVNDHLNCFIHQSVQDMLATFHIAEMEFNQFCNFVSDCINQPKYCILRQLLSGILCDQLLLEKAEFFFEGKDFEKKRRFLQDILKEEVNNVQPGDPAPFDLLLTLYEASDGAKEIISGSLKSIAIRNLGPFTLLSPSRVHIIGTVLSQCTKLDLLEITTGHLSDVELCSLWKYVETSDVEISRINMSRNNIASRSSFNRLGKMARHCKTKQLYVLGIDLQNKQLEGLRVGLSDFQLEHLNISHHPAMDCEENMLPELRSYSKPVTFTPDLKGLEDELLQVVRSHSVVLNIRVNKLWEDAPYDLVHSISCLFPNVKESIVLYGWKINKSHQSMLQSKLDEQSKLDQGTGNLKVHITKKIILTGKFAGNAWKQKLVQEDKQSSKPGLLIRYPAATGLDISHTNGVESTRTPEKRPADTKAVFEEEFWKDVSEEVKTITNLHDLMSSHELKSIEKLIDKIQIVNQPLSEADIGILRMFPHLAELELRGRCVEEVFLGKVHDELQKTCCEVSTLSITMAEDIDSLIPSVCKLMKLCQTEELNIEESTGSDKLMATLAENLKTSGVCSFHKLDLSYNTSIVDFKTLGQLLGTLITGLKMVNCDLENENLQMIQDGLSGCDSKLDFLDISHNTSLTEEGIQLLAQILRKDKVRLLALEGCDLSEDELEGLDELLVEIGEINLSYNTDMSSDGLDIVGRTITRLKTKRLGLAGCNLDEECLDSLLSSTQGHELSCLDIKGNVNISPHVAKLSQLIQHLHTENLNISECRISGQQISDFIRYLGAYKLKRLDISDSERKTDKQYIETVCELLSVVDEELVAIFPNCDEDGKSLLEELSINQSNKGGPQITVHSRRRMKRIQGLTVFGTTV